MKRILAVGLGVVLCFGAVPASGGAKVTLRTDQKRHRRAKPVTITLRNGTQQPMSFESPWVIKNEKGEAVAGLYFQPEEQVLAPGGKWTWTWDSSPNVCGSDGTCTEVGGYVPAGRYRAVVRTDHGRKRAEFSIGQFFTLGFRGQPGVEFTVFSIRKKAIDQMRAEANAGKRTKIVSGIVRWGTRPYNPAWKFNMGPASIVLGEMFTEVCDGRPGSVQRHRRAWEGERWCPWSSYVKRRGK